MSDGEGAEPGYLRADTQRWIQEEADKHFRGDFGAAAAAILEAAHDAEQTPADPWAGLEARLRARDAARAEGAGG